MSKEVYSSFIDDYNRLIEARKDIGGWKSAQSKRYIKGCRVPLIKDYFDYIVNKYDYIAFKGLIMADDNINIVCEGTYTNPNNKKTKDYLILYYTIGVYCSFIVEELIYKALSRNKDNILQRNNTLDYIKKIDFICNNNAYQIKNKSFIYDTYEIEIILDRYRKINDKLRFIFYSFEADNIYICMIDREPYKVITDIHNFTNRSDYVLTTLDELINALEREGRQ